MGLGTGGSCGVMLTGTSSLLVTVISLTTVFLFLHATVIWSCHDIDANLTRRESYYNCFVAHSIQLLANDYQNLHPVSVIFPNRMYSNSMQKCTDPAACDPITQRLTDCRLTWTLKHLWNETRTFSSICTQCLSFKAN